MDTKYCKTEQRPNTQKKKHHHWEQQQTMNNNSRTTALEWTAADLVLLTLIKYRESPGSVEKRGSAVVECLTRDRGAASSSLVGVTALFP